MEKNILAVGCDSHSNIDTFMRISVSLKETRCYRRAICA